MRTAGTSARTSTCTQRQQVGSERITRNAYAQSAPAISGDWVVYQDHRAGNADIYAFNIIAGVEKQVTDDLLAQQAPVVWHKAEYPGIAGRTNAPATPKSTMGDSGCRIWW